MLTHFWDADGDDFHIISLDTDGDFSPGDEVELCNEPYVVERVHHKLTGRNESLHVFVREQR